MCDLAPLQGIADDLTILKAVGMLLEDVTAIGGDIRAETVAGLGTLMKGCAARVQQAIGQAQLTCNRRDGRG